MSSDKGTKSMWLRFFREAGIPPGFDTKYALVFDENRIKKDMLMDINKECLRDIGITAMGDIIAILKHAKQVYEEFKAQAYDIPQPTSTVKVFAATSTPKSSSPSSGSSTSSAESREPRSVIINSAPKIISTKPQQPKVASSNATGTATAKPMLRTITSRQIPSTNRTMIASSSEKSEVGNKKTVQLGNGAGSGSRVVSNSTIVRLKRSVSPAQREEVPVQKKTRVLPEQEGSYIVKMPSGSIPKTQKLLQDRLGPISTVSAPSAEKKSSVFSRLGGEGRVSSSSDVQQRGMKSHEEKNPLTSKSSVFSRLGQGSGSTSSLSSLSSSIPPLVDYSDFMKTRFEVRQSVSPAHQSSSSSSKSIAERIDQTRGVSSLDYRNDGHVSSTVSRMRSSLEGNDSLNVKARLGLRETALSKSQSRSISPPQNYDSRVLSRGVSRPSPVTSAIKPRSSLQIRPMSAGHQQLDSNAGLSVSRQVVREERFKNAEGKNMVKKTFVRTVRKRI